MQLLIRARICVILIKCFFVYRQKWGVSLIPPCKYTTHVYTLCLCLVVFTIEHCWILLFYLQSMQSGFLSSLLSVGQQSHQHVWNGPHAERRLERLLQSGLHVLRQLLLPLPAQGELPHDRKELKQRMAHFCLTSVVYSFVLCFSYSHLLIQVYYSDFNPYQPLTSPKVSHRSSWCALLKKEPTPWPPCFDHFCSF